MCGIGQERSGQTVENINSYMEVSAFPYLIPYDKLQDGLIYKYKPYYKKSFSRDFNRQLNT